jgi:thymidylate kinase
MSWSDFHGRALDAVFDALNLAEIPWLVLRNHKGLPWHNASKDIDIGVEQQKLKEAEIVVEGVLKKHGFDRKETTVFQWGRCTSYFGVVDRSAVSIKIDLMDGFSWRTADLFNAGRLLQCAVPCGNFLIPSKTDDATIMWLKPLMTGGFVKQAYVTGITEGISADPIGFRSNLDQLFRIDIADLAWQHLENGKYEVLTAHRGKLSQNAWTKEVKANPVKSIWNAFSYVSWELLRRSRRPRASFLAVLGPDGAGKTTFIHALRVRLAILQSKDLETIEVRHFRPHLLPNINQLLTGKPEVISKFNNPHSAPPAGKVSSFLRIGYYSLDYILGYWLKIRRLSIRGRTMIFDRYFYDFIVDPQRSRLSLPLWVVKIFLFFIPKPDLIIVLDTTSSVIYARKQELQPEEIDRQLTAYRKLADDDLIRFLCLDSAQSPEAMVDVATQEVITRLYPEI